MKKLALAMLLALLVMPAMQAQATSGMDCFPLCEFGCMGTALGDEILACIAACVSNCMRECNKCHTPGSVGMSNREMEQDRLLAVLSSMKFKYGQPAVSKPHAAEIRNSGLVASLDAK